MTKEEIKKKVLAYNWEYWLDRPFGAFMMSLFKGGQSRSFMRRVGVDAEWPAMLFQKGAFYKSTAVWDAFEAELNKYLSDGGKVADVVKRCEDYAGEARKRVEGLKQSEADPKAQLSEIYDILTQVISFVWLAHGFEHIFAKKLRVEVPRYMPGDVEKNIGDISFPKKKNAHYYFAEALKSDISLEEIQKKFGWIKARGGFLSGFSIKELEEERNHLKNEKNEEEFSHPNIPEQLKDLASVSQDLVYFRTLRTDVLYELMWISRPILTRIAQSFGLTFDELRDYSALDLMEDKLEKYEYDNFSAISYGNDLAFFHERVLRIEEFEEVKEIKGAVAFKGITRGIAKIVKFAQEIDKVKEGDVIVAPTTSPSYITGMRKARAFITDEGGITSHAAIVSREMRKPCIIGTKIATKVLKDGDLVEVDAERGIVRKI